MIGNPPNIGVPTHFAKVVLTSRPSSPATPNIPEISAGAFVLPNAEIPDQAPLESFVVPGAYRDFCVVSEVKLIGCVHGWCSGFGRTRCGSDAVFGCYQIGFETYLQVHEVRSHCAEV